MPMNPRHLIKDLIALGVQKAHDLAERPSIAADLHLVKPPAELARPDRVLLIRLLRQDLHDLQELDLLVVNRL